MMKNALYAVAFLSVISLLLASTIEPKQSLQVQSPNRTFTLILDDKQVNALIYVIDQSNAAHATVVEVQKTIYGQVEAQIKASQYTDSLANVKSKDTLSKPKK